MSSTDRYLGALTSLAIKAPCKVATTGNITLYGEQTIESKAIADGDRVLVMAQTDAKENGIYVCTPADWLRASDFDGNDDFVKGTFCVVNDAITPIYQVSSENVIIGTTDIAFASVDLPTTPQLATLNITADKAKADYIAIIDSSGEQNRILASNIPLSAFEDDIGIQSATTSSEGLVQLATDDEVRGLSAASRAVTPSGLGGMFYALTLVCGASPTILIKTPNVSGWTVTREGAGIYRIDHNLALTSTNDMMVLVSVRTTDVSDSYRAASTDVYTQNSFKVYNWDSSSKDDDHLITIFCIRTA